MSPDAVLHAQLRQFANHLRDPATHPPPPDVPDARLAVYRDLFFNNIERLLAGAFPVMHSVLPVDAWRGLVRDFYRSHRCETPLFPLVASEFVTYLANAAEPDVQRPFLAELAQYEWAEVALRQTVTEELAGAAQPAKPGLSPACWPLAFRFPVHRIGPGYQPVQPGDPLTCLLLLKRGDEVCFIESNPATFRLLHLLADDSLPDLAAVARQLADEMQHADAEALRGAIESTVAELVQAGVLVT